MLIMIAIAMIAIEHLVVFPQNPLLSDHYLITFECMLPECTPLDKAWTPGLTLVRPRLIILSIALQSH